jgi:hypothetical protein
MKRFTFVTWLSVFLNLAALFESKLAVFGVLLATIALAAGERTLPPEARRPNRIMASSALGVSVLALSIFILKEALPGIAEARYREAERDAVSRLRELLFAQDSLRKLAFFDPDHDGIGSAGFLSELVQSGPARDGGTLSYALLESRFAPRTITPAGPALADGEYLFYLCLPALRGGFTANPGDRVDTERAERQWFAWAWPANAHTRELLPLAIDQDERIVKAKASGGRSATWRGPNVPPPCDLSLLADPNQFEAWRGKKARKTLPYSR